MMKNRKLVASTVVEVIVALVILMIVFGIGGMVYINIMKARHHRMLQTEELLTIEASKLTIPATLPADKEYDLTEDIHIRTHMEHYKGNERLLLLELEAVDPQEKTLASLKKIILNDEAF